MAGMGFRLGLRLGFRRILLALAAASYCVTAQAAPAPIDIPADGITLHATLYRPDGDGPFPAVVALHDCDGLSGRQATQAQLYTEWANILVAKGFVVLPKRWIVERSIAWLNRCRRLAKDWESYRGDWF